MIGYERYRASRIVTVQEILSANYYRGTNQISYDHFHEDAWEMVVCLEGNIIVLLNYQQHHLNTGSLMFIRPCLHRDLFIQKDDATILFVSFTCTNSKNMKLLLDTVIAAEDAQIELFYEMISEIDGSYKNNVDYLRQLQTFNFVPNENSPMGSEQMICCYLEQVIIGLIRSKTMDRGQIVHADQFKEATHSSLANQVTAYIEEHLGEKLTVKAIASHFNRSRTYLSTVYKYHTGFGINEMITHIRIKHAKMLLLDRKMSVSQISEELGFSTPQYFSSKFTEEVGVPPSKYAAYISCHLET